MSADGPADTTAGARTSTLVKSAVAGDKRAKEALVRRYLRPAYCVALAIVGRPADAEDVAQDALILGLAKIGTCRSPERFEAWLMQIVRNQARNWLSRRRLRDVPGYEAREGAEGKGGARDTERQATRRQLTDALTQLTEVQRTVVLLHDLEGYTHPEIAAVLDLSVVNSRQHLFVARRRLRQHLGEGGAA
ncbi:MAG: RNA polymerase sigma factor [Sandaracinaceae bacterium]